MLTKIQVKIFFILLLNCAVFLGLAGCSTKDMSSREAMVLYQEGMKFSSRGEFEDALERFNRSAEISRENAFEYGIAHNYNEIGNVYTYKKEFNRARDYYQQALAIYQKLNMANEASKSLDNIAKSFLQQGYYGKSLDTYKQLVDWDESRGNQLGKGIAKFNMALIYERYIKDFDAADQIFNEAYTIFLNLGRDRETEEARKSIRRVRVMKEKAVPRD